MWSWSFPLAVAVSKSSDRDRKFKSHVALALDHLKPESQPVSGGKADSVGGRSLIFSW